MITHIVVKIIIIIPFTNVEVIITLCLIAVTFIEFLVFLGLNFKSKNKPSLWIGFIAILISFAISGVRQDESTFISNHFTDAVILALVIFVYFFFAFTLESNSKEYISKCFLYLSAFIGIQFILTYVLKDADLGDNIRPNLKWGISNAGALIMLLGLPCGGYLYLKKSNTLYFVLTRFSFLALLLSTSRGGILCAIPAYIATDVYCGLKVKDRKVFSLLCIGTIAIVLAGVVATLNYTQHYIQYIIDRFLQGDNLNDFSTGRIELYQKAIEAFLSSPIIGIGTTLSVKYGVTAWYHSTLFDTLAALGIVGLVAFGYHFYQKYRLLWKYKKDSFVIFMYIGIICSGLYGMIDVSYYNLIWLFIFVMMMAAIEAQVKVETLTPSNT